MRPLVLALAAELALIALAIAFMVIYSVAIHPGERPEFYEAQAPVLLPYVAVAVSLPLFFGISKKWCRSQREAYTFCGLHVAIDLALALAAGGIGGLWLLSQAAKLLGCRLANFKH